MGHEHAYIRIIYDIDIYIYNVQYRIGIPTILYIISYIMYNKCMYIYIEREGERERENNNVYVFVVFVSQTLLSSHLG